MHAVLQAKMPRWLACTSSSIIIQQESNKPINQLARAVFSRHARMADGSHARARATFLLLQCPRPQHANAMQQILVLRIECFSVNFCGLWFNSIYRSTSRGTIRTSPFVKLKASSNCIHVGTDGRDDPQGRALLLVCYFPAC